MLKKAQFTLSAAMFILGTSLCMQQVNADKLSSGVSIALDNFPTAVIYDGTNSKIFHVRNAQSDQVEHIDGGVKITSSNVALGKQNVANTAYIKFGKDLVGRFIGKKMLVRIFTEPNIPNSSKYFAVSYSAKGAGDTGQQKISTRNDVTVHDFSYVVDTGAAKISYATDDKDNNAGFHYMTENSVPAVDDEHYLNIWADVSGQGKSILIRRVEVSVDR